jgi:5'-nucleotidase, C-terminal domain
LRNTVSRLAYCECDSKGKPLDDNALYTLATTEFIALQGGDGYAMFKQARLLSPPEQAKTDSEILNAAIAARPTIAPKVEGRIKRLDAVAKDRPKDAQYYNELLIEQSGLTRSVSNDGAEDYQVTLQENGYDGQPSKSSSLLPLRSE